MLNTDLKKMMTERYQGWAETWGVSFCFALTQSVEKSERLVADAIVALIASDSIAAQSGSKPKGSVSATRFAATLWGAAQNQLFRAFSTDSFFRMSPVARAVAQLKGRAQFSRQQIADALSIRAEEVDAHLENARLLFSGGKPWIQVSPTLNVSGTNVVSECPAWVAGKTTEADIQHVFARYVGSDLDSESGDMLHNHLLVCSSCRTSFGRFKQQYMDWVSHIPQVEADQALRKHLGKVSKMALTLNEPRVPRLWPGVRKQLERKQVRAVLAAFFIFSVLHFLFR